MADVEQMGKIYDWFGEKDQYDKGASNKEVLEKFGDNHKDSWELLKRRARRHYSMFYENGKWFRWAKPPHKGY